MSEAVAKTNALVRKNVPIALIDPASYNPNEMSEQEFNLLYDNMLKVGFVDPVFLRPLPNGRYKIVGGHHRVEVAKLLDFTEVPATIIEDPEFDEDQEKFQNVRMNMIRGKLNPKKFLELYHSLDKKYESEIMAEAFGFADQEMFRKMVGEMKKTLPPEMQDAFVQAAEEVKTIDGLSKLLNSMFTKFGNTLEHGWMILDYGGKDSVWVKVGSKEFAAAKHLGSLCVEKNRTMDDILGGLLLKIKAGELNALVDKLVEESTPVK